MKLDYTSFVCCSHHHINNNNLIHHPIVDSHLAANDVPLISYVCQRPVKAISNNSNNREIDILGNNS